MANRRLSRSRGIDRICVLMVVALVGQGCATYSDKTEAARNFAAQGSYDEALAEFNKILGVEDIHAIPDSFGKNSALILLERGMLHLARGDHDGSRGDLQVADKELEMLDLSNSTAGDIGKYIYSDSSGAYKISPVERLSLNAMNILNYLALGDLRGARVEAGRFTVMRNFMKDTDPDHAHGAMGSYLSGFVYEKLGENDPAMHHYDDALEESLFSSLIVPISQLAVYTEYRGKNIENLLEQSPASSEDGGGEIIVIAGVGRVPFKIPQRMPIGAAIGIVSAAITENLAVLERSAFKFLVFPDLVSSGSSDRTAEVRVDGTAIAMDRVTNFGASLTREYEEIKPKIITAAVSRMITRAVAAEAARAVGDELGGFGGLVALATEGLMVTADKPDTRSWTLLPDRVFISRTRVPAGTHQVEVSLDTGEVGWQSFTVEVPKNGFATVVAMPLR